MVTAKMNLPGNQTCLPVRDYDLAATLVCGQAFRWQVHQRVWEEVIADRWVRLESRGDGIAAQTAAPQLDWQWLVHYLQADLDLDSILRAFPDDEPMRM